MTDIVFALTVMDAFAFGLGAETLAAATFGMLAGAAVATPAPPANKAAHAAPIATVRKRCAFVVAFMMLHLVFPLDVSYQAYGIFGRINQ
ncbi:hypothetical protein [Actinacidiphila oryziradicis]|uniref:hypothetical protein n=1 Tax=Actinacidiphila oryziradicis TaxID=2571141 RepID=UPI0023F56D68|nr:hypothetical protein [Actinacidiphila oryziradicis]